MAGHWVGSTWGWRRPPERTLSTCTSILVGQIRISLINDEYTLVPFLQSILSLIALILIRCSSFVHLRWQKSFEYSKSCRRQHDRVKGTNRVIIRTIIEKRTELNRSQNHLRSRSFAVFGSIDPPVKLPFEHGPCSSPHQCSEIFFYILQYVFLQYCMTKPMTWRHGREGLENTTHSMMHCVSCSSDSIYTWMHSWTVAVTLTVAQCEKKTKGAMFDCFLRGWIIDGCRHHLIGTDGRESRVTEPGCRKPCDGLGNRVDGLRCSNWRSPCRRVGGATGRHLHLTSSSRTSRWRK